MHEYTTKEQLYKYAKYIRLKLNINEDMYPINLPSIISQCPNIYLDSHDFKSEKFCALAFIGDKADTIILNSNRTAIEQNFDCGHEIIHIYKHASENVDCFQCFESARPSQDHFLEWQANEGSAELCVPYKLLLPEVKASCDTFTDWRTIDQFKEDMAKKFNVTPAVINYRLESLKYEIAQYLNGVPIEEINILSNQQQLTNNICVKSLNDLGSEYFSREIDVWQQEKKARLLLAQ